MELPILTTKRQNLFTNITVYSYTDFDRYDFSNHLASIFKFQSQNLSKYYTHKLYFNPFGF